MRDHVTIVAEGAQGFEGSSAQAMLIVRAASAAGADIVKFQLVYADELAVPGYRWYELFGQLEMPDDAWRLVAAEARTRGVAISFDVYGPRSLSLALDLGAEAIKIHSTDFFNHSLVDDAIASGRDVWFSIGGIRIEEVHDFLRRHQPERADQLTLLYGFQAEPTANADNHLRKLGALRAEFPALRLGFMDHAEAGTDPAGWLGVLALPFGVQLIEKHVTIGRRLELEDHQSALDAADFGSYVERIRLAEMALGAPDLGLSAVELAYRRKALKSVVTTRALAPGTVIGPDDVVLRRAAAPEELTRVERLEEVIGRTVSRPLQTHQVLSSDDLG